MEPSNSLWHCPVCDSPRVQVSLPAWFHQALTEELEFVEPDKGADIMSYYCEDCRHSAPGLPTRAPCPACGGIGYPGQLGPLDLHKGECDQCGGTGSNPTRPA